METQRQHEQEQKQPEGEQALQALIEQGDGEANGIPVVRANTPRPLSFMRSSQVGAQEQAQTPATESLPNAADFPVEAPAAPPVPEEEEEGASAVSTTVAASSSSSLVDTVEQVGQAGESAPEFLWLFEYGLEMDEGFLNSPDRLNGQAHTYGPAVLKGYRIEGFRLHTGSMSVALMQDASSEHEVWGVLYRIPRRLTERRGSELSLLDRVHAAHLYRAVPVVVQEMYRRRAVQCVTYVPGETGRAAAGLPSPGQVDASFARRLLEVARQRSLPEGYLQEVATVFGLNGEEQNTEPLAVLPVPISENGQATSNNQSAEERLQGRRQATPTTVPGRGPTSLQGRGQAQSVPSTTGRGWLLALALYLVAILMGALGLAVVQSLGEWKQFFSAGFAPLGAPWYVLLYGLLGGCISCMMALGRAHRPTVPGFVMLTWFARPFLGMVLAALAYLALFSGAFNVSMVPEQRYAVCSVVGALAGLCEGWLFFRRK